MKKQAGKVDQLRALREASVEEAAASPFERHTREVRDAIQRGRIAFEDLGAALRACKDSGSWREKYTSWTEACESEWGISRQHAHRLIQGVKIMDLLRPSPTGDKSEIQDEAEPLKSLPRNEGAMREFTGVPDDKVPEVAERASEIADGKPPTSADVRKAKAEIIQEPAPEPPPEGVGEDDGDPDPYEEIQRLLSENRRLSDLVDQITESDAEAELARWSERYARLEGRVSQLAQTAKQAESTASYATGLLRKIRKALGVERDRDILPALDP